MAAVHFNAQLRPGPDISDSSPDFVLVQRLHKVAHDLLEVIQGLGLDTLEVLPCGELPGKFSIPFSFAMCHLTL